MDVLRIRDKKLTAKFQRDEAVKARVRFLASVAESIQPVSTVAASTYLHRASLLCYEEYGQPGSLFSKDLACERCGAPWKADEVCVATNRIKRIPRGKLKRLRNKQLKRPWMLTRFQKRVLKQQTRSQELATILTYECAVCAHLAKVPVPRNNASSDETQSQHRGPPSLSMAANSTRDGDPVPSTSSSIPATRTSATAPHKGQGDRGTVGGGKAKKKRSLLQQVKQIQDEEASLRRSPLRAFLSGL